MDILIDDCLIHIFEYLPIVDRIRLQRVSKRWYILMKESWKSFRRLDIRLRTWKSVTKSKKARKKFVIDNAIVNKVLILCGQYLTSIDFSRAYEEEIIYQPGLDFETFKNICINCPNIREILPLQIHELFLCNTRQNCTDNSHKIVPWLMPLSQNITKLGLNMMSICDSQEDIARLFANMRNLKSIRVESYWSQDKECLLQLPLESLEEIMFIDVNMVARMTSLINSAVSKSARLHTIVFKSSFMYMRDDSVIKALFLHSGVKTLRIEEYDAMDEFEDFSAYISETNQLEALELKWCTFVNDHFLKTVSKKCGKLKKLNITGCKAVTNIGIRSITGLKELRCLAINNLEVTTLPVNEFLNLDTVSCSYCFYLDCCSIYAFVRQSHNLRFLDARYGESRTNKLLVTAIESISNRKNNKDLTIKVDIDEIDTSLYEEIRNTTLLNVCNFHEIQERKSVLKTVRKCCKDLKPKCQIQ